MEERLNSVDCQYLLIQIFKILDPETLSVIAYGFSDKESNPLLKEYLFECIFFANEIRKNPEYCASFDCACKTILARQGSSAEKRIHKKDYVKALGWNNRVQLNRIERGEAQMRKENVSNICGKFVRECDRRFWQNQLLAFFPRTLCIDCDNTLEYAGLTIVLKSLREKELQLIQQTLTESDWVKMRGVLENGRGNEQQDPLGDPPYHLYKTILHLVRNAASMTLETLVKTELQTSMQSWYDWKGKWEKAEETGFAYLPEPSLKRKHLLLIAVVFNLEYLDTIRLLQMGGYRVGLNKTDRAIINCFLQKNGTLEERKDLIYRCEM